MTRSLCAPGLVLALVLASAAASAQPFDFRGPRIRLPQVAKADQPITIASLDVRALIDGLHAETTQTVVFFNPNDRVLEGDLEFPLPDGATVSGFGLDVGGQVVEGVVVPKEQARVALETEIRKGVDPGLVEQVRGNLYRTRIYPIPAHGTRTVRLRWVSTLATKGTDASWVLPVPQGTPVAEVSLRVEVVRGSASGLSQPVFEGGFGPLANKAWEDRWVAEAKFAGASAQSDLVVRLPQLPSRLVAIEQGQGRYAANEAFFAVTELIPERATEAVAAPRRLALAWDASGSRTPESTERELGFLTALLKQWKETAVDLVVFRERPEKPKAFAAGDPLKLIDYLRAQPNDGGTALAALDLSQTALPSKDDGLWILCSDGLATLGEALPKRGGVRIVTVSSASVADRSLLRALATESGGAFADLSTGAMEIPAAVTLLTRSGVRLLQVQARPAGASEGLHLTPLADRQRVEVTGHLLAPEVELTLTFGTLTQVLEKRTVLVRQGSAVKAPAGGSQGPIATAWAQGEVEALALFEGKSQEALLALGRRFGLVTPSTSILVLETLEQHLTYRIEPAASRTELHARYLEAVAMLDQQKQQETKSHLDEVARMWKERTDWWSKRYDVKPGFRYQEEARMKRAMSASGMGSAQPMASRPASAPREMEASFSAADGAPPPPSPAAKSAADDTGPSASIAIQPWDPEVPYLLPLKKAEKGHAYEAYLVERRTHQSPAFFLDCAEFFLRAGNKEKGLRILTNLAELRLDDPALLRVLAWRLSQAGELELAEGLLEKVLRLRPEEPQSRRDLALVLADRAEAQNDAAGAERAVGLLYQAVQRSWDRFPEIELIALMELNRILARGERRGWGGKLEAASARVDSRLRKLLDVDLRVSLSWDADLTDVDLHVFEPTNEHAFFSHNRTTIGGLVSHDLTQGYGPEEYLLRRALPGKYEVKVHYYGSRQQTLVGPATMIATVFTHWGRADEKKEILTLRLDSPKDLELVGVVTIGEK